MVNHLINQKTYSVALPDYIANGGDDCEFLTECKRINTGMFLRDAVILELKKNDPSQSIDVDNSNRILID